MHVEGILSQSTGAYGLPVMKKLKKQVGWCLKDTSQQVQQILIESFTCFLLNQKNLA